MIDRYSTARDGGRLGRHDSRSVAGSRSSCWPPRPTPSSASCRPPTPRRAGPRAPTVDDAFVAAVLERERTTDHDVAAFVDVVQAAIGAPAGSWIHYGLTSVRRRRHRAVLGDARRRRPRARRRSTRCCRRSSSWPARHRDTVMIGRTHGIHAEPTTFGAKVALWALQLDRDRARLAAARAVRRACASSSGAVGTYSNVDPAVEAYVGDALGLRAGAGHPGHRPRPPRRVPLRAAPSIGATCELVAVELRHLQRTEVGEVLEGFKPGQKGSSAMPHKRNPISAETISGLPRVVRSNLQAGLQDIALWHERDISHSSVERVILPDSSLLAHYVVRPPRAVCCAACRSTPSGCVENLWSSHGLVFSQPVLLALVPAARPVTTPIASCNATRCGRGRSGTDFRSCSKSDPDVTLVEGGLDDAFDLQRSLRHLDRVAAFDELDRGADHDERGRPRAGQAERLMPAFFSTAASTPTSRHDGVRDPLALAVGLGDLDERRLDGRRGRRRCSCAPAQRRGRASPGRAAARRGRRRRAARRRSRRAAS